MMVASKQPLAVISGASAGIGKSTACMLVQQGWHVIGIGRDPERSADAEVQIRSECANGARVDFIRADFTEMAQIRRAAEQIQSITSQITVLINNAGDIRNGLYVTNDGLEATFAANHLAPFLLTHELLPQLKKTAHERPHGTVRVISVSSSGHEMCSGMNWSDLNMFKSFTPSGAYCQAKLANILFTRELNRRIAPEGMVAQSMHPGRVDSNFLSHGDEALRRHRAVTDGYVHPDEPAKTLVWMATSSEAGRNGGRYFHDMREVAPAPQALDDAAGRHLWDASEAILRGIGY